MLRSHGKEILTKKVEKIVQGQMLTKFELVMHSNKKTGLRLCSYLQISIASPFGTLLNFVIALS